MRLFARVLVSDPLRKDASMTRYWADPVTDRSHVIQKAEVHEPASIRFLTMRNSQSKVYLEVQGVISPSLSMGCNYSYLTYSPTYNYP